MGPKVSIITLIPLWILSLQTSIVLGIAKYISFVILALCLLLLLLLIVMGVLMAGLVGN